ncbi:hypothetical protein OH76DRAFT_1456796 [Lentinus brumalis]|uniref:Uncharacterized protein n=1 Tax=Lentinus brumalis TaxID=2498619 RepID=A0A371D4I5_9APHY|nr:hypothetical protein OH76DRAFT_1456796 [Polyporus brumalis]
MHNLFLGELRHHCISVWGLKHAKSRTTPQEGAPHTPEQQEKVLNRIRYGLQKFSEKTLGRARLDYLDAAVRYNGIQVPANSRTRADYARALVNWVQAVPGGFGTYRSPPAMPWPSTRFRLPLDEPEAPEESSATIFNSDVLRELQKDIKQAFLPSWLEKPPSNIGEASHGKLKADHWRTLCTVSMVITLEETEALECFMHLVAAVDLATRRTMSADRANAYDSHMEMYLRRLRTLYNANLTPNHHLALHLKDFLLLFGPTHGWWAFPFERYNGLLQRLKTNSKPSDMPTTFMRYFYLGAMLRWMMDTFRWPGLPEYADMMQAFRTAFASYRKGTHAVESVFSSLGDDEGTPEDDTPTLDNTPLSRRGGTEKHLPNDLYNDLLTLINRTSSKRFASYYVGAIDAGDYLPPMVESVDRVEHKGVTFGTVSRGTRNSFVMFSRVIGGEQQVVAGQISEIIMHTRRVDGDTTVTEPFLLVNQFKTLSEAHRKFDPYLKFLDVPSWLCYNVHSPERHLLRLEDIISHCATYVYTPAGIEKECIVIRSLDRVSRVLWCTSCVDIC